MPRKCEAAQLISGDSVCSCALLLLLCDTSLWAHIVVITTFSFPKIKINFWKKKKKLATFPFPFFFALFLKPDQQDPLVGPATLLLDRQPILNKLFGLKSLEAGRCLVFGAVCCLTLRHSLGQTNALPLGQSLRSIRGFQIKLLNSFLKPSQAREQKSIFFSGFSLLFT